MTRKEKSAIVKNLIAAKLEVETITGLIEPIFGCEPESNFSKLQWKIFERMVSIADIAIDDDGRKWNQSWLQWFVWENDCGRKGLKAWDVDEAKPIDTIDDFLDLIGA